MPGKKISSIIRQKVIEAGVNELSPSEIAEKFGISISSVRRILKEKSAEDTHEIQIKNQPKTERQKKIEDLEKRIAELEKKILAADTKKRKPF